MIPRGMMHPMLVSGLLLAGGVAFLGDAIAQSRDEQEAVAERPREAEAGLQIKLVRQATSPLHQFVVLGLAGPELQRLAAAAAKDPQVWQQRLVVTVVAATKSRPMLGDYAVRNGTLSFTPRFPLRPGTTYRAEVFQAGKPGDAALSREFALEDRKPKVATRLTAIYPSSRVLPENQLKFYLQFSSPMSRGQAYRRIRLLDSDGKQVEFPFLELGEELWDPSGTRFTLFFDPGRIKRGLQPRELFGPALVEGGAYTLVIDAEWLDARGQPLQATQHKRFRVVAPDDRQPATSDWDLVTPAAGSRQPLVVSFGEPLDHAMLQRVLWVLDKGGNGVAGNIVVSKQESQWSFQPDTAWVAGEYALRVDAALEDLAGNSIGRPFEVDVFEKVDRRPAQATVQLPFEVRP